MLLLCAVVLAAPFHCQGWIRSIKTGFLVTERGTVSVAPSQLPFASRFATLASELPWRSSCNPQPLPPRRPCQGFILLRFSPPVSCCGSSSC